MQSEALAKCKPIGGLVLLALLAACGADTQNYVPSRDLVEARAGIEFDAAQSLILIKEPGQKGQSDLVLHCEVGFDSSSLEYDLVSDEVLRLGEQEFTYTRALSAAQSVNGVPERLFAVWGAEPVTVEGTTLEFEIEIQDETLIYRNTCTR